MITITPYDEDGNAITELYQWDRGITAYLTSDYITSDIEVHFANKKNGSAYVVNGTYSDGILTVAIPDILLESPHRIYGYVYYEEDDLGKTILVFSIRVERRAQPSDLLAADTSTYLYVDSVIAEIKELLASAQEAEEAATAAAESAAESATSVVETAEAVTAAAESAAESAAAAAESAESVAESVEAAAESAAAAETSAATAETAATTAAADAASAVTAVEALEGTVSTLSETVGDHETRIAAIESEIESETDTETDTGTSQSDTTTGLTIVYAEELPETGDLYTIYFILSESGDAYDKYIYTSLEQWEQLGGGGSTSYEIVEELPETGDEAADYYLLTDSGYIHYRYIDGAWYAVGGDSYTKDEVDTLVSSLQTNISANASSIEAVKAELESMDTMVSDVTFADGVLSIYFADGESKSYTITTDDVYVSSVAANSDQTALVITYSNGDEEEIAVSTGSGTTSVGSATITRVTDASIQTVYGEECLIEYAFAAYDSAGDVVGDGTGTWYVNSVAKETVTVSQGSNSFDISDYLSVGSNTVKLTVTVDTGGDSVTTVSKTWTVTAINMYLLWDYDDTTINEGSTFTLYWTPYGDVEKTSHIIIDDVEAATSTTTRSGVRQSMTLDALDHGAHMVEIYLTATVSSTEIQSASVVHDMIFVDSSDDTPIIAVSLDTDTMTQYDTLQIPVVIYTPGSSTSDATLAVDGETVDTWSGVDRTVHYWNYSPTTSGEKTLTITSGVTTKTITLTVEALDIDVEEIDGAAFKLRAADLASNEALQAWTDGGVSASFSDNFDWTNGGIQSEYDDNGNLRQYICVKAGTTMTLDYELFGGTDPKTNGRNFKIIFKVENCRDYDAEWLDCVSNGIGLSMCANSSTVSSLQNSCETQYAEGRYTEYEYDIYPSSQYRYLQSWIDGVQTMNVLYASDDDFNHPSSDTKQIVIGSSDCDVYIYLIRAYEVYITRDNHVQNFIADGWSSTEMVSRYNRNQVVDDSLNIDYSLLADVCPDLRIHLWQIPQLLQDKKNYVTGCTYQQIWHKDDSSYARHQVSADGVKIRVQGTSSMNYFAAAANTDGNFEDCTSWTDGNGDDLLEAGGYSMEDDSIPVTYFNTKVNVASCENINNMCLAQWYQDFQPYKTAYRQANEQARDTMELHMGVQFIRDLSGGLWEDDGTYHMYAICNTGNSKKNVDVFHDPDNPLVCCVEVLDNQSNQCMMLDTSFDLDDLQSEEYFEFRHCADDDEEDDDGNNIKSLQEQAWIDFVLWMAESNPAAATDEALDEAVTYGSYTFVGSGSGDDVLAGLTISDYAGTYTTDCYEYRMAKMLSECEDHMIMDSVVYHYVFIETHTMVDNVCKNTFWESEDLQHWQLTKNYDNDTADGINNTGLLAMSYGCEGMDTLDDGYVFNGKDAVWWQFIYGLYDARALMWTNREAAGAWDYDAYLDYVEEQQELIPERVWNQDYWYKYLRLYEEEGTTTYFEMLQSGKKTHQRAAFVEAQTYYQSQQYMGSYCTSSSITLRGYTPSTYAGVTPEGKVWVAMYRKGYIVVQVASAYKHIKVDAGVLTEVDFSDQGDMNDTVINIHGANLVQQVGDLSCLYVGRCDFSAATKLRYLQIGSDEEGYSNGNLSSVSFGTNTMLEELYIQNCPNVTSSLDLSGCLALLILDIQGSGFTGVTFATNGLLTEAYLCAVASLTMRSLYNLTDDYFSLESYDNLVGLRLEDCTGIDSLALVQAAANLTRIRITGIDWTLSSTDLLNALLELAGYDESSTNITQSVLAGEVTITGDIRQQELDSYAEAWEDLTVNYSSSNLVTTYLATYVNADGTVLYTCYVDQEDYPPDPVAEGYIDTPTQESDAQYDYTYSGWDNITDPMRAARTITATYDTTTRTYTINWYALEGDSAPLETQAGVEYGSEVEYSGDWPTRSVSSGTYSLFAGWDKSTGYITGDTDVYAIWERASIPESGSKDLSEMSIAEIYAICEGGEADSYFEDKDYFDFTLGHDFEFDNVESETLLENQYFDGATAIDTEIYPFSSDMPTFTMAIDYEFQVPDETSATLVSAGFVEDGSDGFRLRFSGTSVSGHPNLQWGDKNSNVGYGCNRNILVLRHEQGSTSLFAYAFNLSSSTYDDSLAGLEIVRSKDTESDEPLTFGAVKVSAEDAYTMYGKGWIYWAKIWYADLGEINCEALASWPHETMRMEFSGADRYYLAESSVYKANGSFYPNNPLPLAHCMNTSNDNTGGWDECAMREFLTTRYYAALPDDLKSAIKQVKIKASEGAASAAITTSSDYVYLPANREVGGSASEPYVSEGDAISYYSSNSARIKFCGMMRTDDEQIITSDTDPTMLTAYKGTLSDGDIWINTNDSSVGYMYISADTLQYHDKFGAYDITNTSCIEANDGGWWLRANAWWERSPYASSSTYFMYVSGAGNPSYNYGASSTNGICPGFSI